MAQDEDETGRNAIDQPANPRLTLDITANSYEILKAVSLKQKIFHPVCCFVPHGSSTRPQQSSPLRRSLLPDPIRADVVLCTVGNIPKGEQYRILSDNGSTQSQRLIVIRTFLPFKFACTWTSGIRGFVREEI